MYIIIDIAIVLIIALFVAFGIRKGFARTLVEAIGYILAVMIAFSVGEYTANYVYENNIKKSVVSSVSDVADNVTGDTEKAAKESVDKIWNSIPPYVSAFSGITGLDKDSISDYLDSYSLKNDETIESVANSVSENVIKPIVVSSIKFVVSIVLIIVLLFIVKLLARLIGGLFNKSVFRGLNRFLGGIAGCAKGMIIVLMLVALLTMLLPIFNNEISIISPENIDKTYIYKLFYNVCTSF